MPPRRPPIAGRAASTTGHGGKRPGAGRKRSALDDDLLARLGEPPIGKPLKLARWYQDAISILTHELLKGRNVKKLLEAVRQSSAAAARVLPHDIMYQAQKILESDERELKDASAGAAVVDRKGDRVAQRAKSVRRDPT